MPLRLRNRTWPKWAVKAMAPVLAKYHRDQQDVEAAPVRALRRAEAMHGAEDEEEPLASSRELEVAEKEERGADGEEIVDVATNFRELMEWSAADKKADNFIPIAGNMYRYWGLGIMPNYWSIRNFGMLMIFAAQLVAPPACIVNNLYRMDWSNWRFGVEDWHYVHGSKDHGISNLSKHIVATIFLTMFTLNGAMVLHKERVASMKISAMMDQIMMDKPDYLKDVSWTWLVVGRVMNCLVVVQCCVIVYFSFVLSDTPMDVLFNSMAVTFLYNLDDIDGEMGFLMDDDWDGEQLGKLYYHSVDQMMDDAGLSEQGYDADQINDCPPMKAKYTHWTYKIAEPLVYLMTVALPMMYIFIDDLHCKPYGVKLALANLAEQVADLQAKLA